MALKLGYEVLRVNGVTEQESVVYQRFIELLDLPVGTVRAIEQDVEQLFSK